MATIVRKCTIISPCCAFEINTCCALERACTHNDNRRQAAEHFTSPSNSPRIHIEMHAYEHYYCIGNRCGIMNTNWLSQVAIEIWSGSVTNAYACNGYYIILPHKSMHTFLWILCGMSAFEDVHIFLRFPLFFHPSMLPICIRIGFGKR